MSTPAVFLSIYLLSCLVGMLLIAALYLHSRKLDWWEVMFWYLVMLLIPIAGPFLTIAYRPGSPRRLPFRSTIQRKKPADKASK